MHKSTKGIQRNRYTVVIFIMKVAQDVKLTSLTTYRNPIIGCCLMF